MLAVNDFEQGSLEWMAARAGIPSASNFDKIITTKGERSKQRERYMFQLAGERITGTKESSYQNDNMRRGIEIEAEARRLYELLTDLKVDEVGLCYPDEKKLYACSPDGLVGEDGGMEIKCPLLSTHVSYLLDGTLPTEYFQQVQGALLVTGRKWWDFVSYFPSVKPLIVRVERDEKFIKLLEAELIEFCRELESVTERIR